MTGMRRHGQNCGHSSIMLNCKKSQSCISVSGMVYWTSSKNLEKQKAVLSEKRTKRRNEVYYGFSKNERGRRGWKDHSWY